jgi:glucose/mannose-6-phosphate isomerase
VIILKEENDDMNIKKRMKLTKELIRKKGVDVLEIGISGGGLLTNLFSAIHIGDWTSYYLALEYGVDPSPVDIIEDLKNHL